MELHKQKKASVFWMFINLVKVGLLTFKITWTLRSDLYKSLPHLKLFFFFQINQIFLPSYLDYIGSNEFPINMSSWKLWDHKPNLC